MSLTRWIRERFKNRRARRAAQNSERRNHDVCLYLRRLEDRRVLSVTAVEDAYFVDEVAASLSVSAQLGVLSNDTDSGGGTLFTQGGEVTTDEGGTVFLDSDGSFDYFSPQPSGSIFVDQFTYTADNGTDTSSPTEVQLFVGEVPIPFEQPTLIPLFGVESQSPTDPIQANLFSSAGGSLTILEPDNITFDFGTNGESDLSISGTAEDINKALDTLEYTPPAGFSGFDDLFFDYTFGGGSLQQPGGQTSSEGNSQIATLFVESPDGGPGPGFETVFAVDDEYYVDPEQSSFFASPEAGLLSNDFSTEGDFLFTFSDIISTDLGGTVELSSDGSFSYTPPDLPEENFIDSFVYTVSNETDFADGVAVFFVGEVPVPEDFNVRLPVFTVEGVDPQQPATIELTSAQGASLTLASTAGITFVSGNNGDSSIAFSGLPEDLNFALDTLDYAPPLHYSGPDTVSITYEILLARSGSELITQAVPIDVKPIADPPGLSISPQPVEYLAGVSTPVDINVTLVDADGSEIPGFVILDFVPPGVIPSVGQQSPIQPETYFILPSELENLTFFVEPAAPENFTITVLATSIEKTDEPGVFGGPGGPLLPTEPFEPRFAISGQTLSFVRLPPPEEPAEEPMQTETVFLLGPLSVPPPAPPPGPAGRPNPSGPQNAPQPVASVIESNESSGSDNGTTTVVVSGDGPAAFTNNATTTREQDNEQGRRSYGRSGIYVRKLNSDGSGQIARLPEELSEDYAQFMAFLKKLPNGDYVVYFKRGGQSHDQAAVRQVVVKVRVVNHRLNPDPGEFKPAGEVAEPPQNPDAESVPATTEAPEKKERAEIPPKQDERLQKIGETTTDVSALSPWRRRLGAEGGNTNVEISPSETNVTTMPADVPTPISASAWLAVVAAWKLRLKKPTRFDHIDRLMEQFPKKPSRPFKRRKLSQGCD